MSCWRDPHHERGVVFGFDFDGLFDAHSVHPLSAPSAWAQSQEMPALLLCAMQVTRRLSGMVIDRQVRGLVLAALRALPANDTLARVDAENLWQDQIQLDSCIASLDDDGLIEILENGALRLPHD